MWTKKSKYGLYFISKFRLDNLNYLKTGFEDSKECFSAIKVILRLAEKNKAYIVKKIIKDYSDSIECFKYMCNKLELNNLKNDQLLKFVQKIIDNRYKAACKYSSNALIEVKKLNEKYASSFKRLGSYVMDDYCHIISSSAFRRLQDKAQVYSLENRDFVRSRLTHSNEVASNAEIIANYIDFHLFFLRQNRKYQVDTNFNNDSVLILRCAGLLHDIGNPPFGHFGEEAIQLFFKNDYIEKFKKNKISEDDQLFLDFAKFDGNAQSLRIATKLQYFGKKKSLFLTAGVLGSIIKYPFDSKYSAKKKFGYFYSEKKIVEKLNLLGVYKEYYRNPLTLILEAADDVSYLTADLEDAIHKRIIDLSDFENVYIEIEENLSISDLINVRELYNKIKMYYTQNIKTMSEYEDKHVIFEKTMRSIIADIRYDLLKEVAYTYIKNYSNIFEQGLFMNSGNTIQNDLLSKIENNKGIVVYIKKIMEKVFKNEEVFMCEIKGYTIIKYLLKVFCDALSNADIDINKKLIQPKNKYDVRIISLISNDFIDNFFDELQADKINDKNIFYYKMKLAVDFVSGMTDSFAHELYKNLNAK